MSTKKRQTGIRFHPDTETILALLERDTGLTKTGVVELAIRDLAKRREIRLPETTDQHQEAAA